MKGISRGIAFVTFDGDGDELIAHKHPAHFGTVFLKTTDDGIDLEPDQRRELARWLMTGLEDATP